MQHVRFAAVIENLVCTIWHNREQTTIPDQDIIYLLLEMENPLVAVSKHCTFSHATTTF